MNRNAFATLVLVGCVTCLASAGCAGWQAEAKTIDHAAVILCDLFFAKQKPALNVHDVEQAFCSTAEQVAPFLAEARSAERRAGAHRLEQKQ